MPTDEPKATCFVAAGGIDAFCTEVGMSSPCVPDSDTPCNLSLGSSGTDETLKCHTDALPFVALKEPTNNNKRTREQARLENLALANFKRSKKKHKGKRRMSIQNATAPAPDLPSKGKLVAKKNVHNADVTWDDQPMGDANPDRVKRSCTKCKKQVVRSLCRLCASMCTLVAHAEASRRFQER